MVQNDARTYIASPGTRPDVEGTRFLRQRQRCWNLANAVEVLVGWEAHSPIYARRTQHALVALHAGRAGLVRLGQTNILFALVKCLLAEAPSPVPFYPINRIRVALTCV